MRVYFLKKMCPPPASAVVAEMNILASTAMAAWALERNIPLLFRTQDVALPKELAGIWTEPAAMTRVMRALIPSSLDVLPKRHAALGVASYAPLTSPLRRYPDLINTAQVAAFLQTGAPRFGADVLPDMLFKLNMYLDAAGQVQRFRPRYWKLLYFRQQGDAAWWDGVITRRK